MLMTRGRIRSTQNLKNLQRIRSICGTTNTVADCNTMKAGSCVCCDKSVGTSDDTLVDEDSPYSCNICLEVAKEPVVTLCGHLYCWSCLFRWMHVQSCTRACPVCKAGVEVEKVIPIYGRGSDFDPRQEEVKVQPVPPRPAGQRPSAVQAGSAAGNQQGVLPALFGFQLGPGQGYVEALTPEQQHQAFLSRLLLMLGSFVIMCLLLF